MSDEYLQDSTGTYLRKIGIADSVEERIMLYQEIPGLLPFEVRWVNGKKETLYDVTGRVSLLQFLKEESWEAETIRNIFCQVFQIEKTLEEYLLEGSGLVVQAEYLFMEKKTGQIYGIYNSELSGEGMKAYSRLLETMMDFMDAGNSEVSTLIYDLHKATKESDGTRKRLQEIIEEKVKKTENFFGDEVIKETGKWENHAEKKRVLPMRRKEVNRSYLTSGILVGIGIFLFMFLWNEGYLNNPMNGRIDSGKIWEAGIFFFLVVGYGVWKTLPERKGKENPVLYKKEENRKKVCLISKWGKQEPISITTFPYRLGRDSELVHQVIHAAEISPIHARMEQEGLEIYVVDEESAQGTFKNGERLVPFHKTRLTDGDVLQLGKEEYVVEIT